jgi:hypothetical protein
VESVDLAHHLYDCFLLKCYKKEGKIKIIISDVSAIKQIRML